VWLAPKILIRPYLIKILSSCLQLRIRKSALNDKQHSTYIIRRDTLLGVGKMLGELIYEAMGKTLGLRVLDDNGTMEMTIQEQGVVFGTECTITVTLVGKHRPNGIMYSEGHGIMVTKDGDTATLTLSGITIPKGLPPIGSIRGATFFNTQSPKLARLNSVVCVFEAEVNADHSYSVKDWEWK